MPAQDRERKIRVAGAFVFAVGVAACGLAIFSEQLGLGPEVARGTFGWRRASLLTFGGITLALGALLVAYPRVISRQAVWERIRSFFASLLAPSDPQLTRLAIALLAVLGLTLVWTRLLHIGESLWHDEAVTVLHYSGVGPGAILLGESPFAVNNHVAYNLLSWATVGVLGESEAVYRLWSVLPGIAAIAFGAWWAWRRLGPLGAVAFATIAVAGPLHLEYVPQARGYGLTLLAATLMLIAADGLTRGYTRSGILGFLAAGVMGIWTLSIFAFAYVGQALALLRWRYLRLPVIGAVAAAGALSVLFYAPVLGEMLSREHMEPSGLTIPFSAALLLDRPLEWLVIPTVTMLGGVEARGALTGSGVSPEAPWATWLDVAVFGLLALGAVSLWRRGSGGLALILLAPPLFFNLAFSIGGLTTVTRHQLFLLPFIVALVAAGIAELGRIAGRHRASRAAGLALGVVAVLVFSGAIVVKEQRNDLPRESFQQVASIVQGTGIDTVVTDSLRPEGLVYYLGDDVEVLPPDWVASLLCDREREVIYIHHRGASFWSPAEDDCVLRQPGVRIRVPQGARGRAIDLWIVDPRAGGGRGESESDGGG